MIMVNPDFHIHLRNLAQHAAFRETTALSGNNLSEQYDSELVLRFLVFSILDLQTYDRSAKAGSYLIAAALGSNAFHRFTDGQFKGGFLLSPFEVIAYGLGFNYPDFPSTQETEQRARELDLSALVRLRCPSQLTSSSLAPTWQRAVCQMSIRTVDDLSSKLNSELAWRKKELSDLEYLVVVIFEVISSQQSAIIR